MSLKTINIIYTESTMEHTLTEKIKKNEAEYVSTLSIEQFYVLFPCDNINDGLDTMNKSTYFALIKQYIKSHQKFDFKGLSITYKHTGDDTNGRLYSTASISLQRIGANCRAFLTQGLYHDYDMSSAHPTILLHYSKKHNLPCKYSELYVADREKMLNGVASKTQMLKLLNMDKAVFTQKKSNDLHCLVNEWNINKIKLNALYDITTTNTKNPISSVVNKLLCIVENEILQKFAIKPNVFMFDGFMTEDVVDMSLLQNDIVKWVEKPILSSLTIPTDFDVSLIKYPKLSEEEQWDLYNHEKPLFEITHAKVLSLKGSFIKIEPTGEINILTRTEMINSYEHLKYGFIKKWLADPTIRLYDSIDCFPNIPCPDNVFNTWIPFAYEECSEEITDQPSVDLFLEHLNALCNYEAEVTAVIIKWVAHLIQFPQHKSFVPAFISGEGAGKGTLLKILEVLLGHNKVFETTDPLRDVFGNFNSLMATCHLVCLNEISKNDTAQVMGKFKGLVSDPHIYINDKGKSPFKMKSHHKFIIFSNNEDPIRSNKGDRRLYIIKSSDALIDDKEYFTKMNSLLTNKSAMSSIYYYFKTMPDIPTTFNVCDFAKVAYQETLKEANRDYVDLWMEDFTRRHVDEIEVRLDNLEVLSDFKCYCSQNDIKCDLNGIQFHKKLMLLNINGVSNLRTNSNRLKQFDIIQLKKKYSMGCLLNV